LRLLADDLVGLRGELDREVADEEAIRGRRKEVDGALVEVRGRESTLEQAMAADAPLLAKAQETWYRLSALEERFRGRPRWPRRARPAAGRRDDRRAHRTRARADGGRRPPRFRTREEPRCKPSWTPSRNEP